MWYYNIDNYITKRQFHNDKYLFIPNALVKDMDVLAPPTSISSDNKIINKV